MADSKPAREIETKEENGVKYYRYVGTDTWVVDDGGKK